MQGKPVTDGAGILCGDLTILRIAATFFIDKVQKMRGGPRVTQRTVVIFQINAVISVRLPRL